MVMEPIHRLYQSEDDYWRIREFLRRLYLLNGHLLTGWHVARLDYAWWHVYLNVDGVQPEEVIHMWESEEHLVAVLLPDGDRGEAHFLVHPHWRTAALEEDMLAVAEEHLAASGHDDVQRLTVWTPGQDSLWARRFESRGYRRGRWVERQWYRDLTDPIEGAPIPTGYYLRSLGDGLELLERCYASGLAFHDGDIVVGIENRDDPTWYRNIQNAPLYRRDLDLVAISAEGAVAAFCTVWFDDVTRSAYFEPVGTTPAHRRLGLGKALLTEGLRRLQRMGATRAFVCGYSAEANALYRSAMGPTHTVYASWVREWAASESRT